MRKLKPAAWLTLVLMSMPAHADLSYQLEQLIGYTIVDVKTVEGWYDEDGEKGDSFEGCDYGRVIVFSDDRILECSTYHYHYAYRPRAVILSNGSSFKMIVDDHVYDMRR
jgi:hypothetical protein